MLNNGAGIVPPIRRKIRYFKPINQSNCLRATCCCTLCNKSPERDTMRIHGQMSFALSTLLYGSWLDCRPLRPPYEGAPCMTGINLNHS